MKKYKLALVGSGSLGSIIGKGIVQDLNEDYQLLGVLSGQLENAKALADQLGCQVYRTLEELIADKPDYVIEAATPEVVTAIATEVLAHGIHLIPLSVGALADVEFYNKIMTIAVKHKSRVHIPSGAVGGFEVLRASQLMEEVEVSISTEKSPKSLNGAPYLKGRTLSEEHPEELFNGLAKEAISHFPKNVNVAVATALVTTGAENVKVTIHSIPGLKSNKHTIKLVGRTVKVKVSIETRPSKENPKSSALAAYSVLALLKNLVAPITF